jgi:chloramphenicol-sensitive protein RarD
LTAHAGAAPAVQWREGVIAALLAYVLWGVLPVYFKLVVDVDAREILAHRILWAVPFGLLIVALRGQVGDVTRALRRPRTLALLSLSAAFIAVNWLVYISAVVSERIFEASLGYYINPLVYVLAGVLLFNERLNRTQIASVALAAAGVLVLTLSGGTFPAISLTLAFSFTMYGVIRKYTVIGAMPGLLIETLVLFPLALAYLVFAIVDGSSAFRIEVPGMMVLLMLAGPITVLPLLFFALAARRLPLATLGFIQFLAPTMQFLMGVYYGERLTTPYLVCFACIWLAVALFAADAWRRSRQAVAAAAAAARA